MDSIFHWVHWWPWHPIVVWSYLISNRFFPCLWIRWMIPTVPFKGTFCNGSTQPLIVMFHFSVNYSLQTLELSILPFVFEQLFPSLVYNENGENLAELGNSQLFFWFCQLLGSSSLMKPIPLFLLASAHFPLNWNELPATEFLLFIHPLFARPLKHS